MTTRLLIALDVEDKYAADVNDLIASVHARLADEAGYLTSYTDEAGQTWADEPIVPNALVVAAVDNVDPVPLTADTLNGVYAVGIEGVEADSAT